MLLFIVACTANTCRKNFKVFRFLKYSTVFILQSYSKIRTLFTYKKTLLRTKSLSQKSNLKTMMITCNFNLVYLFRLLTLIYPPDSQKATEALIHRESIAIAL